jgi:Tol biopolymer transport system component
MRSKCLAIWVGAILACVAEAQSTERVSVDSFGVQANDGSQWPSISSDGRYVSFMTLANNLVPGDTAWVDVFLHDRHSGETSNLNVGYLGDPGNGHSYTGGAFGNASSCSFSADNRYVVFVSQASNLVPADTNGVVDVFVRDLQAGVTTRVGVGAHAVISADGRYVALSSLANLVPEDTNGTEDVFVYDRTTSETTRVSVTSSGLQTFQRSYMPAISADGRYVAFISEGQFLVPNDTNLTVDVFLHDRQTAITTRVSVDSSGAQGENGGYRPQISASGRYIVFTTGSPNLTPDGPLNSAHIVVHDRITGSTTLVSRAGDGTPANSSCDYASISPDGRFVAFASNGSNLVPGDTNSKTDAFVRDLWLETTVLASVASNGAQGNHESTPHGLSADGRYVVFDSRSSTLVPGDTGGFDDIFVRDLGPGPITSFCFGDGSIAACPCGNSGTAEHGCANPVFSNGGFLRGFGVPSVGSDSVSLQAQELSGNVCVFFQGDAQMPPAVIDDGLGCVSGAIVRIGTKSVVNALAVYPEAADLAVSVRGAIGALGGTRYYQGYYRGAVPTFCPPATTNRTNGISIVWTP